MDEAKMRELAESSAEAARAGAQQAQAAIEQITAEIVLPDVTGDAGECAAMMLGR